ncbi:chemotaxis protein CheW [Deinococcus marmoris]|uniref:chemotaxis protein CheW n=1 Tax=Deinococcus marmoris TaxID=249408 RepID=UPI00068C2336|nr:chemotaxis protein CheW [Deinococcus marmoris]
MTSDAVTSAATSAALPTTETYLLFRSGARLLALPTRQARQVMPLGQLSPLPACGGSLLGLMGAQGRAVPVVNLPTLLGHLLGGMTGAAPQPDGTRLGLLCEHAGESLLLPIDEVIGNVSAEVPAAQTLLQEAQLGDHHAALLGLGALTAAIAGRLQTV